MAVLAQNPDGSLLVQDEATGSTFTVPAQVFPNLQPPVAQQQLANQALAAPPAPIDEPLIEEPVPAPQEAAPAQEAAPVEEDDGTFEFEEEDEGLPDQQQQQRDHLTLMEEAAATRLQGQVTAEAERQRVGDLRELALIRQGYS